MSEIDQSGGTSPIGVHPMTPSKLRYPTPCPFAKEPVKTTSESAASAVIGPGGPAVVQTFSPAESVAEHAKKETAKKGRNRSTFPILRSWRNAHLPGTRRPIEFASSCPFPP